MKQAAPLPAMPLPGTALPVVGRSALLLAGCFLLGLFGLLGLFSLNGCGRMNPGEYRSAHLTEAIGTVQVRKANAAAEVNAIAGMNLASLDVLHTGVRSEAHLDIDEDKHLDVWEQVKLTLQELAGAAGKDSRSRLTVSEGEIHLRIRKSLQPGEQFEVSTPTCIMGIRGTRFFVRVKDGATELAVLDGKVSVKPSATNTEFPVEAGQRVLVDPSMKTPGDIRVLPLTQADLDLFMMKTIQADPEGVDTALTDSLDQRIAGYHRSSTLLDVRFIAAGLHHMMALQPEGSPVVWGADYTAPNQSHRVIPRPQGLEGTKALAGGQDHTLALKADGTVAAWGWNDAGQCDVPAGLSGVKAIAAGKSFSLALKEDGTVTAWGANEFGQSTPPAGLTHVSAITAGSDFTLALQEDGTVVAWGRNQAGQCTIPDDLSHVVGISAGEAFSIALKADRTVVAWGSNQYGQCTIPTDLSDVAQVEAGAYHVAALKSNGTLVLWGDNNFGACNLPAGLSGIRMVAAGGADTLALLEDGTLAAWGYNGYGECNIP